MLNQLRALDWKVIFFALVGAYLLPALIAGSLVATRSYGAALSDAEEWRHQLYMVAVYLGCPTFGGYFTARFAKNRPKLHVLIVAVLGVCLAHISYQGALLAAITYSFGALTLAALGAFIQLRSRQTNGD